MIRIKTSDFPAMLSLAIVRPPAGFTFNLK
jgi:hypothetical protein